MSSSLQGCFQVGTYKLSGDQVEAGLPREEKLGELDVHVSSGCGEGVCFHEGESKASVLHPQDVDLGYEVTISL